MCHYTGRKERDEAHCPVETPTVLSATFLFSGESDMTTISINETPIDQLYILIVTKLFAGSKTKSSVWSADIRTAQSPREHSSRQPKPSVEHQSV